MWTNIPLALLAVSTLRVSNAVNVVLSNDDGWAELNIRTFYNALTAAPFNFSVVLSAPAENKSGTGSQDSPATTLKSACEFNSCPSGSPAEGFNASMTRFSYVNSFPVTSIRFGIQTLAPQFFGTTSGQPNVDIAVAGPNVGANLGATTKVSGTVGAATEAAKEGFPAVAFSGTSGSQVAWTSSTTSNSYSPVYATLSAQLTNALVTGTSNSTGPLMPAGTWINVNYAAFPSSRCVSSSSFQFILSRINSASGSTPPDVSHCGSTRLPTESSVVGSSAGCFASVSVGVATSKNDASASQQAAVLARLGSFISCPPSNL